MFEDFDDRPCEFRIAPVGKGVDKVHDPPALPSARNAQALFGCLPNETSFFESGKRAYLCNTQRLLKEPTYPTFLSHPVGGGMESRANREKEINPRKEPVRKCEAILINVLTLGFHHQFGNIHGSGAVDATLVAIHAQVCGLFQFLALQEFTRNGSCRNSPHQVCLGTWGRLLTCIHAEDWTHSFLSSMGATATTAIAGSGRSGDVDILPVQVQIDHRQ